MKTQIIFAVLAAATAVAGGLHQGKLCDRWSLEVTKELTAFNERIKNVPRQIGDWASIDSPVDEKQFAASHCTGLVSRVYKHARTGQEVSLYLVSGKAFHVTLHTPDWCYVAAGYEMQAKPSNYAGVKIEGIPDPDFLNTIFYKETPTLTRKLRILWTYSLDGHWTAPKLAEHRFAGKPALYKVYLITELDGPAPAMSEDPAVAFAKDFFPVVNPILFQDGAASEDVLATRETAATQDTL